MNHKKIGIITSKGGHLYQLLQLKEVWRHHPHFWVTFPGADVQDLLKGEQVYCGHYPESRNLINAVKNLFLAFRLLRLERPDVLLSTGAGIAPPFFWIAKLFHIKTIFIEPYDFVKHPSLSGRLVAPVVDVMLVQHPDQMAFYEQARLLGPLL